MMSDLSIGVRNMKFMQRTSESRKKSLKNSFKTSESVINSPLNTIMTTAPDHPGCWRIIQKETLQPYQTTAVHQNQPTITHRTSVFSIQNHCFTRLSFQNYNKRIESLMIKYGLKQEINNLEDGEIDPNDDDDGDDDNNRDNEKLSNDEHTKAKHVTTLAKTIGKKFDKKTFSRVKFNNTTHITKRRRKTHRRTATH